MKRALRSERLLALAALLFVACRDDPTPGAVAVGEPARPDAAASPLDGGSDAGSSSDAAVSTSDAPTGVVAPFGCVTKVTAGHHVFSCDDIDVAVDVSAGCAKGGCGVVLDVHGLTMDGDQEDRSSGLRAAAASKLIVVQPTAPSSFLGPSWDPKRDDERVWNALRDVRQAFAVDLHRVHVTGFSQGGAMTFRLVCAHGDEIASAAPIAAADAKTMDSNSPPFRLDCPYDAKAAPTRRVPMLHMHGARDGLVPIEKGRQQRDAATAWLGAGATTTVSESPSHKWTRFTANSDGTVYEFIEHDYAIPPPAIASPLVIGGHCFPGGGDLAPSAQHVLYFSCQPPVAFSWGPSAVAFFLAHPKP